MRVGLFHNQEQIATEDGHQHQCSALRWLWAESIMCVFKGLSSTLAGEHTALLPKAECAHETLSSFILKFISLLK